MQYTKPMIELVYEIRRIAPSDMKPGVKLANPELFAELTEHYNNGAKTVTKALIKELFSLAGEDWPDVLQQKKAANENLHTKMYRGTVSLEKSKNKEAASSSKSQKRIYRGQVIN